MKRLHPLTGLLRTGRHALLGLSVPFFVVGVSTFVVGDLLFDHVLVLAGAGLVLGAAHGLASYLRFRYAVRGDELVVHSGVLGRREREIPLGRVQQVDVQRDLWSRLLGLATVRVETAGGGRTEAELAFVAAGEAERLKRVVRERKTDARTGASTDDSTGRSSVQGSGGGRDADPAPASTSASATTLFSLSVPDLLVYGVTEFRPGAFALALLGLPLGQDVAVGVVLALARPLGGPESLALATLTPDEALAVAVVSLPLLLLGGWLLGTALGILGYWGFTLGRRGSDLVYRRGLTTEYSGSIPVSKLQTVTVTESFLQRPLGYAGLRLETAGVSADGAEPDAGRSAVPLAGRDRVWSFAAALEDVSTNLDLSRPPKRARRRYAGRYVLALGVLTVLAFVVSRTAAEFALWWTPLSLAPLALPAAHLKWANRGYALDDDHVVLRDGFWRRSTTVVPYDRIQTVARTQTVFQRRWGLASVVVDTASSFTLVGGGATAHDLPADVATSLRDDLRERFHAHVYGASTGRGGTGDEPTAT